MYRNNIHISTANVVIFLFDFYYEKTECHFLYIKQLKTAEENIGKIF